MKEEIMSVAACCDAIKSIKTIERYILDHMDESLDRKVLATVAGYSVAHFHRIFVAGTGMNVTGYVRRARMLRAGRKLRMGAVDITEVALAAGYQTHAAFSKAFKQHFGLSPSEFRQLGCHAATQLLTKTTKT
jgi:AraC family transcriptional regulator